MADPVSSFAPPRQGRTPNACYVDPPSPVSFSNSDGTRPFLDLDVDVLAKLARKPFTRVGTVTGLSEKQKGADGKKKTVPLPDVTLYADSDPATRSQAIFYGRSDIENDFDGAPNAYAPAGAKNANLAVDNLGDLATSDKALLAKHKLPKQSADDPMPGYYISETALKWDPAAGGTQKNQVNPFDVPYLVLNKSLISATGSFAVPVATGDLCTVVAYPRAPDKKHATIDRTPYAFAHAIFADIGPRTRLGEGSHALFVGLGRRTPYSVPSPTAASSPDKPKDEGISGHFLIIAYPGSGNGAAKDWGTINIEASKLFMRWGGELRLADPLLRAIAN